MLAEKFVDWFEGFLDGHDPKAPLNSWKTARIRDKLNDVFIHDIDPSMNKGRDPDKLQAVHDGKTEDEVLIVSEDDPILGGDVLSEQYRC